MSEHNYSEYDIDEHKVQDLRFIVLGICLLACLLFAVTLFIDIQAYNGTIPLPDWFSIGNVDDARIMLSCIIQAVSTVLGLVFSVVLLVLSMAASQFGPRILRRFIIEQNGQGTIGLFTATLLFSLFTLVAIRFEKGNEFVPHITVFTTIALVIISFGALISFSQSIRKEIQIGNLIARVDEDLSKVITKYMTLRKARIEESSNHTEAESSEALRKRCVAEGTPVLANNAGYLQSINYDMLVKVAISSNAVIALIVRPGHFIIGGSILAYVISEHQNASIIKQINKALCIGPNRTLIQDPEFAIAQIVEIGTRALSSGINDAFTGIACVDWLSNNISFLADLPEAGEFWHDKKGHLRLIEVPVKFPRLVSAAFDMIREAGGGNPAILIRLLQNFIRIAHYLKSNNQRDAIMRQVKAIRELIDLHSFTSTDLGDLIESYDKACAALQHQET